MTDDRCVAHHIPLPRTGPEGIEKDILTAMIQTMPRPDAVIEEVAEGPIFVGVRAGGRTGISSLLGARPMKHESRLGPEAVGRTVAQVAGYLHGSSPFAAAIGIAALNAGTAPDPDGLPDDGKSAEHLIADLGRNREVGIVGEFPFVDSLREKAAAIHLFELREVRGSAPEDRWAETLARLDVLAITGTAILTRKLAYFLAGAPEAVKIIVGPTTPLSPALFRFGADYLCGSVIADSGPVLEGIRSGLHFRALKRNGGISFVTLSRERAGHGKR